MERSQRYVQSGIASKILHMGAVALWGGVVALCPVGDMLLPTGVAVTAAVPLSVLPAAAVGVLVALLIQGGTAALCGGLLRPDRCAAALRPPLRLLGLPVV